MNSLNVSTTILEKIVGMLFNWYGMTLFTKDLNYVTKFFFVLSSYAFVN
jgi:hypothetical protein